MLTRTLARAFSLVILVLAVSAALPAQSVEVMVADHTNGTVTVVDHGLTPIGTVALPPPGSGTLGTLGIGVG